MFSFSSSSAHAFGIAKYCLCTLSERIRGTGGGGSNGVYHLIHMPIKVQYNLSVREANEVIIAIHLLLIDNVYDFDAYNEDDDILVFSFHQHEQPALLNRIDNLYALSKPRIKSP